MIDIRIQRSLTSKKIKALYDDYLYEKNYSGEFRIILPKEIEKYRFGVFAELLQFLITLNNEYIVKEIKLSIDSAEDLNKVYEQEFIYPIVSLFWNSTKFTNIKGDLIKDELRSLQNDFFIKMNSFQRLKSNKSLLINIDHFSNSKGLIKLFENANGFNENEEQIIDVIKKILKKNILTYNFNNLIEFENILSDIGAIIYELIKNTFEWGKSDKYDVPINPSIRGLYLRFHSNMYENAIQDFENTPIGFFLNDEVIKQNCVTDYEKIDYLEITVFDSGIGFIDKFQDKNGLDDITILKKCLIKNQTSSTTNLKSKKGLGLDRILKTIDKKGFLKISTDKYVAYRNMIKDEYSQIDINNLADLIIEDWNNNEFNSSDNKKLSGTFISILYPFNYSSYQN
ncbi:hypothetical protein [Chryseobacterium lathyri]|uniref:hypothetical protein n=1 Tax=Chryseobacterium lathyri TaxID=395933 RepID=UPI001CBED4F1|nr:hypothetical protein [Chryseobacterium lathyri]